MARPARFEITHTSSGSTLNVSLSGELDLYTAEMLSRHLHQTLGQRVSALTLDLRELTFMDSSGLSCLIELNDRARKQGWQLRLIAPQHEAAALVLRVTGADAALPFQAGVDH
jgi:anti-sigma B factor antagonist